MVRIKTLILTSSISLVVGVAGGLGIYGLVDSSLASSGGGYVPSNAAAVVERVRTNLVKVYVPTPGDSTKYTNLYNDCTELAEQAVVLTNRIMQLAGIGERLRPMVGASYLNWQGIPIGVSGGAEWMNYVLIGTIGFQSNWMPALASFNIMWRF